MKTRKLVKFFISLNLFAALFFTQICFAATHFVSPNGSGTWAASTNMATPCSLATANANVAAGDVVNLRGGDYNAGILLIRKHGTSGSKITFQAYPPDSLRPTIKNTTTAYWTGRYHGLLLFASTYVKIDGIIFENVGGGYLFQAVYGSSYNEITNCTFDGKNMSAVFNIWKGSSGSPDSDACANNWIHNNTIKNIGTLSWNGTFVQESMGPQLGMYPYDQVSSYNTISDNVFYCNGHHNLETFSKYNVFADNYMHNEGCMPNNTGYDAQYGPDKNGLWSHRNIQIYDGNNNDGMFNLIEGNRFGHAGAPPENDGGDGFTLTAPKNIFRYNAIFNSVNNGLLLKTGAGSYADNNRIYSNTIYKSGRWRQTGPQFQGYNIRWYGPYARVGNVIKNNLLYLHGGVSDDIIIGSLTINQYNTVTDNWLTTNGDPNFVNPDVSNPASLILPNLNLQPNSRAKDAGTHLTQANGAGSNSKTLIVGDALYFQDGTWGSALAGHQADWIAVGTTNNPVKISAINYATNTITLASPMTWSSGAKIWLYKKSDGTQVLYGYAPDMGAYEYSEALPAGSQGPPRNFRILDVN